MSSWGHDSHNISFAVLCLITCFCLYCFKMIKPPITKFKRKNPMSNFGNFINYGGFLLPFLPMVEIDGMKLGHAKPILQYIAGKHNLYGKNLKERVLIDQYVEGTTDLMEVTMYIPFLLSEDREKQIEAMKKKSKNIYFPIYEQVLRDHGQPFLLGDQFSWADVQLIEAILMAEEITSDILSDFPLLQAFKDRIREMPTIKAFLQPGSKRKPLPDDKYVALVKGMFQMYLKPAFNLK
uniref:glutathione transferase n=1 Tax=Leptobrachium leishanense TaxID=445787 RepID=A0A8C5QJ59_9ANUR